MKNIYNLFVFIALVVPYIGTAQGVFINELHYDNDGGDTGEGIEIAAAAGTDLSCYEIHLYNLTNNLTYADGSGNNPVTLSGVVPDEGCGFGTVWFDITAIQNGGSDAICLYDICTGTVVQFLSYEGTLTAAGGVANGLTSTDIGVAESGSTAIGESLQLTGGPGQDYSDFSWTGPLANTQNSANAGQDFCIGCSGIVTEPSIEVSGVTVNSVSCGSADLSWNIGADADNVIVVMSTSPVSGSPVDGVNYDLGETIASGETVVYNGSETTH